MLKSKLQYSNPFRNASVQNEGRSSNCGRVAAQFLISALLNSEVTGVMFTKFLQNVVALFRY